MTIDSYLALFIAMFVVAIIPRSGGLCDFLYGNDQRI